MEKGEAYRAHVLVLHFFPSMGQGHMNPMLQFSKILASKGLKITVAATLSATKSMPTPSDGSITFEPIYDDLAHGGTDLPSLGAGSGGVPPILRSIMSQFGNLGQADWVLFNSFHKLEEEEFNDAKFVEEVWRTGVRAKVDEKGMVTRDEIATSIREVMEGERSEEIKRNASNWKELANEAVDEGGSSDKNIEEMVDRLVSN